MGDLSKYVKPLEWRKSERGFRWEETECGTYVIFYKSGGGATLSYGATTLTVAEYDGDNMGVKCKAAAKADYARCVLEAVDLDTTYLDGVKAGLEAAAKTARGDGESEFFNPVQAIRALDPVAIARTAQKEKSHG